MRLIMHIYYAHNISYGTYLLLLSICYVVFVIDSSGYRDYFLSLKFIIRHLD